MGEVYHIGREPAFMKTVKEMTRKEYEMGPSATVSVRDRAIDIVRRELERHDWDIEGDIAVMVPSWYRSKDPFDFLRGERERTAGVAPSTNVDDSDSHVMVVSGYVVKRFDDEELGAVIRHELCHLVLYEERGDHKELCEEHEKLLEEYDAPKSVSQEIGRDRMRKMFEGHP